ncbi:hypothetical protein ONZ43_g2704 [Nemania bipapillata]|uniref:Uncharacterized protein n=1 Tax=Nemania bipapillata TaxID=110536 RepID=A0ACC2IZT0_9PEZI|nr:hypothetical protein ONZ43_g2704 [Nemania bipapillata]
MSTFHPFPKLPLEIRQQIWEMSVEPREVAVGYHLTRRRRSPPPSLLHACSEARSHLQGQYTKVFGFAEPLTYLERQRMKEPPIYTWVNVKLDTVYCAQFTLEQVVSELPLVRWLIIEMQDPDYWFYNQCSTLRHMGKTLETVTMLHPAPRSKSGRFDSRWWTEWDDWMESCYFTCGPVHFYTRIIWPEFPEAGEINPDNYLKIERDWRRKRWAVDPDQWGTVSDDDDDRMSAPGRFRLGWRHVPGCTCSYKRPPNE